jgi:hypothetical protein
MKLIKTQVKIDNEVVSIMTPDVTRYKVQREMGVMFFNELLQKDLVNITSKKGETLTTFEAGIYVMTLKEVNQLKEDIKDLSFCNEYPSDEIIEAIDKIIDRL